MIIQDISSNCNDLYLKIKAEKNKQGLSNQDIADKTGVPISNIRNFFAGNTVNPSVYYVSAVCICLGISLDKLMDIPIAASDAEADARITDLERQVHDLNKDLEANNRYIKHLEGESGQHRPVITALTALCIFLTLSLVFYMALDARSTDIGLFRSDNISAAIVVIAAVIVVSAAIIAVSLIGNTKKSKENHQ